MAITTRTTLKASQHINDAIYNAERAGIAAYAPDWVTTTAAGDRDSDWLDISGATLTIVQVVPSGTLTATVQASVNDGKTFNDLTPEVGAASITAAGIYRYRGAYQYLRFKATALSADVTVSVSFVAAA